MSSLLSIRIDEDLKAQLELLGEASQRSKSFLAAEAIRLYVERESWQLAQTKAGIDDLDHGRSIPHEEVKVWLESWGTENELPAPSRGKE